MSGVLGFCVHCLDTMRRAGSLFCSRWCEDADELEAMGITKLSREPAPAPSCDEGEARAHVAALVGK